MQRAQRVLALLGLLFVDVTSSAFAQQAPVIERIEPSSGPTGTVLRISGRRFLDGAKVRIAESLLEIEKQGPTLITARVLERTSSGWVSVETSAGKVRGPEFTVTEKVPAPIIERVEPLRAAPGSEVVISGRNFSPRAMDDIVRFGEASAVVRSVSPVELRVTVPMNAASGPIRLSVAQAGVAQSSQEFVVLAATAIHDVSPRVAPPGSKLVISGSGFAPEAKRNRVYLSNVELGVLEASEAKLVVMLPRDAVSGVLLVDVKDGGRASLHQDFQVQWPPTVVGFSPTSAQPTALVTVRGTGFGTDARAVEARIGEARANVISADNTQLVLEVPGGAITGRLSIRVNGVGPAWADQPFQVLAALHIKGFSPRSGPKGTVIVVEGSGFSTRAKDNHVRVGGHEAEVVVATATRLSVRVPATQSGLVTVAYDSGAHAESLNPFVVTLPPQITFVGSPSATVGADITINGSGFGTSAALVEVRLGTQVLQLRLVRDNTIIAVLPGSPTTGKLIVKVALQGTATYEQPIHVLAH